MKKQYLVALFLHTRNMEPDMDPSSAPSPTVR